MISSFTSCHLIESYYNFITILHKSHEMYCTLIVYSCKSTFNLLAPEKRNSEKIQCISPRNKVVYTNKMLVLQHSS